MKSINWYSRAIYQRIERSLFPRYKRKWVTLFRYTSALGDALFLTTLAREIKKRNPDSIIHVITGLPAIFERNPDVDLVTKDPQKPIKGLGKHLIRYEHKFPWKKHILSYCAACVDIHDEITLRTYIYPTAEDYNWADKLISKIGKRPILINRMAGPRTDKKNWSVAHWNQLLMELVKIGTVIEVGVQSADKMKINSDNFIDLTGETSIHQIAALMSKSEMLICPITGLLHLASAFDLPTICILGGSEPAIASKYKNTIYLESRPACSDCYEKGPCVHDFICLTSITPNLVLEKVIELQTK